jgi:hypothetical protein
VVAGSQTQPSAPELANWLTVVADPDEPCSLWTRRLDRGLGRAQLIDCRLGRRPDALARLPRLGGNAKPTELSATWATMLPVSP